jgi:hypothetical protein
MARSPATRVQEAARRETPARETDRTMKRQYLHFIAFSFLAPLIACGGLTEAEPTAAGVDAGVDAVAPDTGQPDVSNVDPPLTCCASGCVDTMHDVANCGGCENACHPGDPCVTGFCFTHIIDVPPDPGGPPGDGVGSTVLAISHVYVGDTNRYAVPDTLAWGGFGLNIDAKATYPGDTDVCTPFPGASLQEAADGVAGFDNSWGENILPILETISGGNVAQRINDAIDAGGTTTLFQIDKLGTLPNYSGLTSRVFSGAPLGSPPMWNGNDVWPIDTASVVNGDIGMPLVTYSSSFMNSRQWAGFPPTTDAALALVLSGLALRIAVNHVQAVMLISDDNTSATSGALSGVIATEPLVLALQQAVVRISPSLCQASAFDAVAQQIRMASDIMADGTNTQGVTCNAISIGLGFEAKRVKLGPVVTPATAPDPCH